MEEFSFNPSLSRQELDWLYNEAVQAPLCSIVNLPASPRELKGLRELTMFFDVPITISNNRCDIMGQIALLISRQICDETLSCLSDEMISPDNPLRLDSLFFKFLDRLSKLSSGEIFILLRGCQEIGLLGEDFISNSAKRETLPSLNSVHFLLACENEDVAQRNNCFDLKHKIIDMSARSKDKTVFISHKWGDVSDQTAILLCDCLNSRGISCSIDRRDIGYMDNIRFYEDILTSSSVVIADISKGYLTSLNAMGELSSIFKKKNQNSLLLYFPEGRDFINSSYQIELTKYWELALEQKLQEREQLDGNKTPTHDREIIIIQRIIEQIPNIINFFVDRNCASALSLLENGGVDGIYNKIREMLS